MQVSPAPCPVCGGTDLHELLHQPSVPTNNVVLCATRDEAVGWPRGSFRLTGCARCGFLFNADYDADLVEYSGRIEETQAFSPHFLRFAEWLAGDWIDRYRLRGRTILEVGCGKAEFLTILCRLGPNQGIGYDPAVHLDRIDPDAGGRLTLVADRFGEGELGVDADALVCRHTLEHLPAVGDFLRLLRRWAQQRSDPPVLLFELPDVERVLDEVAFWDLFYEHCSYFTPDTLRFAFAHAGFDVLDVRRVYDDQYLLLEAVPASAAVHPDTLAGHGRDVLARATRFVERYRSITTACRANVEQLRGAGHQVLLWGGGSKAVGFLTSLGVDELIDAVVDVNPHKHGKYLVGTGHRVVGPEALRAYASPAVIVMNPVYVPEITATIDQLGVRATVSSVNDLLDTPV